MINSGIITCSLYEQHDCLEAGDTRSLEKNLPANLTKATNSIAVSEPNICNPQKRFTIVKTETIKPFRRGRWTCMDFFGDSPFEQTQQSEDGIRDDNISLKSVNVDSPIEITHPTIYPSNIANCVITPPTSNANKTSSCDNSPPTSTPIVHSSGSMDDTTAKINDRDIDEKIEDSLELVKMHLVFSVNKAIEKITRKVERLTNRVKRLELENEILRANASEQTLAQLSSIAISDSSNEA